MQDDAMFVYDVYAHVTIYCILIGSCSNPAANLARKIRHDLSQNSSLRPRNETSSDVIFYHSAPQANKHQIQRRVNRA